MPSVKSRQSCLGLNVSSYVIAFIMLMQCNDLNLPDVHVLCHLSWLYVHRSLQPISLYYLRHAPQGIATSLSWYSANSGQVQYKDPILTVKGNLIVEIRRSWDRLISTMRFPLLISWHLCIESYLRMSLQYKKLFQNPFWNKLHLRKSYIRFFITLPFWYVAWITGVWPPCSMQNLAIIGQLKQTLWVHEIG